MAKRLLLYSLDYLEKNPEKVNQEIRAVFDEIDKERAERERERQGKALKAENSLEKPYQTAN